MKLKTILRKGEIKMYESQFVVFAIGKTLYGIPITDVKEIINMQPPSSLPDMPEYLEGIINLRGRIVPIINLRRRFKLADKEYAKESKIIILRDSSVGIHVDEVSEIRTVNDENIEALDNKLDSDGGNVTKVAKVDNQIIMIIDTNSLYAA